MRILGQVFAGLKFEIDFLPMKAPIVLLLFLFIKMNYTWDYNLLFSKNIDRETTNTNGRGNK